jgi:dienelactone hydrolase
MEDTRRDLRDTDLNSLVPDVRVGRRGFVAACLAAGFAVSAEPVGLYGGADQGIPQEQVDKLSAALKASSNKKAKDSTIHVYPDTPHGFNADYRPSYRKDAADDGWKRMLAWFKKHGVA